MEQLLGEYCFPERFREACRACPDYGNDWSCPPGVPSAAEALRPFRTAHVLGMQVFYDAQTRREVSTAEGAEAVRRASYGPAKRATAGNPSGAGADPERGVDHRGGTV